jgi:hypothetical protein
MAAQAGNLVVSVLDKDGKPVQDAVVVVTPASKGAAPKNPLPRKPPSTRKRCSSSRP